jgi:hypothetical protein
LLEEEESNESEVEELKEPETMVFERRLQRKTSLKAEKEEKPRVTEDELQ